MKPGTLTFDPSMRCYKFTATDFERDMNVIYRGDLAFETREGESLIMSGYFPNVYDRSRMVCFDFLVNHSLEAENWEDKNEVKRDNYGIKMSSK